MHASSTFVYAPAAKCHNLYFDTRLCNAVRYLSRVSRALTEWGTTGEKMCILKIVWSVEMAKTRVEEYRHADFREQARDIMGVDRERRKYGRAVDTAGSIARALEKAYQRGRREEREGEPPCPTEAHGAIDWVLIPPRPRRAFWGLCLMLLGMQPIMREPKGGLRLMWDPLTRRVRWVQIQDWANIDEYDRQSTWGPRTVKPLVDLGLLEQTDEHRLSLTQLGADTWEQAVKAAGGQPLYP